MKGGVDNGGNGSGNRDIRLGESNGACSVDIGKFFVKQELLPAVIQENGVVLMLAYMNRESLAKTIESGYTWFYSRSRGELWNKGATSGHFQKVVSIRSDCDDDTLLIEVVQTGAACHTGEYSCFYTVVCEF